MYAQVHAATLGPGLPRTCSPMAIFPPPKSKPLGPHQVQLCSLSYSPCRFLVGMPEQTGPVTPATPVQGPGAGSPRSCCAMNRHFSCWIQGRSREFKKGDQKGRGAEAFRGAVGWIVSSPQFNSTHSLGKVSLFGNRVVVDVIS